MKKLKIILLTIVALFFNLLTVNAQQQVSFLSFVIPCGDQEGEYFNGLITITENQLEIIPDDSDWTIAEMNKAELINSIASQAGIVKAAPIASKPEKKAGQKLKNELLGLYKNTVANNLQLPVLADGFTTVTNVKVIHNDGTELLILVKIVFEPDGNYFIPVVADSYVKCW